MHVAFHVRMNIASQVCILSLCQDVSPTLKDVSAKARQKKPSLSVLQVILNSTLPCGPVWSTHPGAEIECDPAAGRTTIKGERAELDYY